MENMRIKHWQCVQRLLMLKEQYKEALESIYFGESVHEYLRNHFTKLIDKLLIDQDESSLADLAYIKQYAKQEYESRKLRSYSMSSTQSSYYLSNSHDESDLLFKK